MYRSISTRDTYEASFYILYGGKFNRVRTRPVSDKVAKKRGYTIEWVIYLDQVPEWAVDTWRSSQAHGNITDFVDVRRKLKKTIKRELSTGGDHPTSSCNRSKKTNKA